mgnify:CR=1 FL=1
MKIGNIKINLQGDESGFIGVSDLDSINKEEAKLFLMKSFKEILEQHLFIEEEK